MRGLATLKTHLTYRPKFAEAGTLVRLYDDESRPGYIGVPRAFGRHAFAGLEIEDRRSLGHRIQVSRLPDPNHPAVKDPAKQAKFMAEMGVAVREHEDFIACAGTGTGKTASFLHTAGALGRTTLVMFHLGRLLDQWVEEIQDKLGVPDSRIGMIREDRADYEGKDFVVAMLHTLASRGRAGYPPEMFDYFGLVGVDEVHKIGTGQFAPVAGLFNSFHRIGLTATPDREDGGDRVFYWNLGPIRVTSEAEALPMDVHVLDYNCGTYKLWGKTRTTRVQCLTRDPARNRLMAKAIKRFYDAGRQALIVGDSVLHLQLLMDMAERLGVPRAAMGQFTGERQEVYFEKDDLTGANVRRVRKRKFTKEELDAVKAKSQIIFATYGMMTEGIDIPRLDAGLDVTPRSKATQLIGRIRRPRPGKKRPTWITVRDVRCGISKGLFFKRCKDYAASGAEVIINGRRTQQPRTGTVAARAKAWQAAQNARTAGGRLG